jgi:hypothetical protein
LLINLTSPIGASTSEGEEEAKCKGLSFSPVMINSIKGEEATYTCETVNPATGSNRSINTLDVTFATKDDSLIFISYYASKNLYENELPKFEESLKSVKISNPGDISSSATYSEYKKVLSQQANGEPITGRLSTHLVTKFIQDKIGEITNASFPDRTEGTIG